MFLFAPTPSPSPRVGLFNAKTKNMAWDIYGAKKLAFSCQSKL